MQFQRRVGIEQSGDQRVDVVSATRLGGQNRAEVDVSDRVDVQDARGSEQ